MLKINELRNKTIDSVTKTLERAKSQPKNGPSKKVIRAVESIDLNEKDLLRALRWLKLRVDEVNNVNVANDAPTETADA